MDNLKDLGKLSVRTPNGTIIFLETSSIRFLESDGKNTRIRTEDGFVTGSELMKEYEKKLSGLPFKRVHHQYIVNLAKIDKCTKDDKLHLKSGEIIPVSRRKAVAVSDLLFGNDAAGSTLHGIAFLIVNHNKKNFDIEPLLPGKQLIGRKSTDGECDIAIDNGDETLSRKHFFIEAIPAAEGKYTFHLTPHDAKKIVLVGRKAISMKDRCELTDDSVIKAGKTSFLFKTSLMDIGES